MLEMTGKIEKRKDEDRIRTTNCFDCGVKLLVSEARRNPSQEGDDRIFCNIHWKKRFGKKKKLIKRF